ncbi:GNAT family N-acetyltransferase [Ignatzschineria larvae DSM 13226]|uniref:GNAT family N-acetyltransferase n=1 Tax=Ignatzschineria larvae DSM 13226 TaxID=1111732 RepID=A0ABZ3BZE1_9GAMM|nr:GNAT family N-acetyltransferase [Ignatzschineria larvae]
MRKIKGLLSQLYWLFQNLWRVRAIRVIETYQDPQTGFRYQGLTTEYFQDFERLKKELSQNRELSRVQKLLYQYASNKLVLVVIDPQQNQLIGLNMFYFNKRDLLENSVHAGFIGVNSQYQGQKIASTMRERIKHHFMQNGLKGISSRISLNNEGSLRSALKVGFKPVEKYYDNALGEERYYLVCDLENEID